MKSESTVDVHPMREPAACASVEVASDLESGRRHGDPPTTPGRIGARPVASPYPSIASGRYRVGSELGHGGMGIVFEAWDTQLDRPVAIKLLMAADDQPGHIQRFLREARIASRLDHPGVMAIHEFGTGEDGHAFIVMSLLHGRTLKDLLNARADIAAEIPRFLGVFLQVCQTIAYGHDGGGNPSRSQAWQHHGG